MQIILRIKRSYLIFLVLFITSCSSYDYYPTYQDIPTNAKSKEFKGSGFASGENKGVQLSYSITNYFGTFLCLSAFDDLNFRTGAQIMDFGAFCFKPYSFGDNQNIKLTYSLTSGYGIGQNNRYHEFYDLDIKRVFLQPSLSFTSKFVDFGISSRFSYVDYKIERYVGDQFDYYFTNLYDVGKKPFYFIEPNCYVGLGYKGIKVNYHLVKSNKLNNSQIKDYNDFVGYVSLSFKCDIEDLFKK